MRYLLLLCLILSGVAHANPFDRLINRIATQALTGNVGGVAVKAGPGHYPRSRQLGLETILSHYRPATGYQRPPLFRIDVGGSDEIGGRRLIFAFYSLPLDANHARAAARADRMDARIHDVLESYGATPQHNRTRISGLGGNAPLTSHRENFEIELSQTEALKLDLGAIEEILQAVARTR
jgi:hypothetical protein